MEAEQLIARVQELTGRLEDLEDPECRELAEELTGAVVQMYGAGLERIVELIEDEETRDRLAADELVAGLLMIHDLYPVPLEERVTAALDSVRPYMESHGGNIELLERLLHRELERRGGRPARLARALEAQLYDPVLDPEQLDVAAVRLRVGPDGVERLDHPLLQRNGI